MVVFALTLVRHGETNANKNSIIQGQMDVPLSETGLKQADLLGERLQNQLYTHVFASDLIRAQQTVRTIINKSRFVKRAVVNDERLRERKFGAVEGKSVSELKKLARLANQAAPDFTPSGAETIEQVRKRAVLFFGELCENVLETYNDNDEKSDDCLDDDRAMKRRRQNSDCSDDQRPTANVLVVSHGGLLREMVDHFVEDLGCSVPGGKGQALRLSPNASLSKFTVSYDNATENPTVICLLIHDKDHLVAGQVPVLNNKAL